MVFSGKETGTLFPAFPAAFSAFSAAGEVLFFIHDESDFSRRNQRLFQPVLFLRRIFFKDLNIFATKPYLFNCFSGWHLSFVGVKYKERVSIARNRKGLSPGKDEL